jgi:hypothetical protein
VGKAVVGSEADAEEHQQRTEDRDPKDTVITPSNKHRDGGINTRDGEEDEGAITRGGTTCTKNDNKAIAPYSITRDRHEMEIEKRLKK